jgi:hypothetical protein
MPNEDISAHRHLDWNEDDEADTAEAHGQTESRQDSFPAM